MNLITNNVALFITGLLMGTVLLMILMIILMIRINKYNKNIKLIFKGKEIEEIDKVIVQQQLSISELYDFAKSFKGSLELLEEKQKLAYQYSNILKYDAFEEMGGKMSFVLVMLDEKMDGFILNSIHNNTGCYNYLKEIIQGKCDKLLSKEEKIALEQIVIK